MRRQEARERAELHLLAVRAPAEWRAGHIAASQHIPLGQLRDRLGELPKDGTILAVCRSGSRSDSAARGLRTLGYTVENLEGGVTAWKQAGLPLEAEGGGPGRVI